MKLIVKTGGKLVRTSLQLHSAPNPTTCRRFPDSRSISDSADNPSSSRRAAASTSRSHSRFAYSCRTPFPPKSAQRSPGKRSWFGKNRSHLHRNCTHSSHEDQIQRNRRDKLEEIKTVCQFCNKKATMNLRTVNGMPVYDGEQVQIGDQEYLSVCRHHWDTVPIFLSKPEESVHA